jgi:hypothetical protein
MKRKKMKKNWMKFPLKFNEERFAFFLAGDCQESIGSFYRWTGFGLAVWIEPKKFSLETGLWLFI